MKRSSVGIAVCIAAVTALAGASYAGYVDSTGKHRGVAEFRSDAQACASTWSAEHPRPAAMRPHPVVRAVAKPATAARSTNRESARYNFIMYQCLPAYGWRPTAS